MDKRQEWFQLLQEMGCIVCLNNLNVHSEPDIHHIIHANKRIDDFHTLPLCPSHHRGGIKTDIAVSRHPWKKEFERRYGTEMELLEQVKELAEGLRKNRIGGRHA